MSRDQRPLIPLMSILIVLIDQISNVDEHLYLLLGQEIHVLRIPIQKPYQINVYIGYKAGKLLSIMQSSVDWREIFMKQCRQMQTN